MDWRTFFDNIRPLFHPLNQSQVEGMEKIISYRDDHYPRMPDDELAYVLATVYWETAHTMVPVKEYGSERYLRAKPYWPHIGVGLVQVTWAANWKRFGINSVEDGLSWPVALHAAFKGMVFGMFTGKKLADYIGGGRLDYVGARRIINGSDRAVEISKIANVFRAALIKAKQEPAPPPMPEPVPVPPRRPDDFREQLIALLRSDEEVRALVLEIVNGSYEAEAAGYGNPDYGPPVPEYEDEVPA